MFALLNANFHSGPMGLTKFTSDADEAEWAEKQDQKFEKTLFPTTAAFIRLRKPKFSVVMCQNATEASLVSKCKALQAR